MDPWMDPSREEVSLEDKLYIARCSTEGRKSYSKVNQIIHNLIPYIPHWNILYFACEIRYYVPILQGIAISNYIWSWGPEEQQKFSFVEEVLFAGNIPGHNWCWKLSSTKHPGYKPLMGKDRQCQFGRKTRFQGSSDMPNSNEPFLSRDRGIHQAGGSTHSNLGYLKLRYFQ